MVFNGSIGDSKSFGVGSKPTGRARMDSEGRKGIPRLFGKQEPMLGWARFDYDSILKYTDAFIGVISGLQNRGA